MGKITPVILAGGHGTRLWPLSRQDMPKQFYPFFDKHSLFQKTCERLNPLRDTGRAIVVGQQDHRFILAEQLRQIGWPSTPILLEPAPKNTAPAVALAAWQALAQDEDALLLVVSSDHMIEPATVFQETVRAAEPIAAAGYLVTFGIVPTHPEIGYGYITVKNALFGFEIGHEVDCFVEKPSLSKANDLLSSQQPVFWNSGMFLFSAKTYLSALEACAPKIYKQTRLAMAAATHDLDFIRPDAAAFLTMEADSIDYAVLEKTSHIVVVPLSLTWSDVGSFSALSKQYPLDPSGNTSVGDTALYQSIGCHVHSTHRLVVTLGLKDITVIETPDVVLVMDKAADQLLKVVVNDLKDKGRNEIKAANRVARPWGDYEVLDSGPRFQVKRICVKEGARLSLQLHHHRSEHWVVVKGSAKVTKGVEEFLLTENQSVYIPIGVSHRLENIGKIPLEIIEVQSGSYLGEDDIVRLEDNYGRLVQAESTAS